MLSSERGRHSVTGASSPAPITLLTYFRNHQLTKSVIMVAQSELHKIFWILLTAQAREILKQLQQFTAEVVLAGGRRPWTALLLSCHCWAKQGGGKSGNPARDREKKGQQIRTYTGLNQREKVQKHPTSTHSRHIINHQKVTTTCSKREKTNEQQTDIRLYSNNGCRKSGECSFQELRNS